MIYKKLGNTGLKVSAISLGSWRTYGQEESQDICDQCMRKAYDAGVNFFDGAEVYGLGAAENAMGEVFRKVKWPRDTFIVSSKVMQIGDAATQRGLSRKHLVEACDGALKRMGLDYLDLFFCHRPDPHTPLEEIVHTMNELIGRGKIFYWGTSEFPATDIQEMIEIARRDHLVGPSMEQTNHSMLHTKRVHGELAPLIQKYGLGTTIYSPLAVGRLTGKYSDGIPEDSAIAKGQKWMQHLLDPRSLDTIQALQTVSNDLGVQLNHLALAWGINDPAVSTAIIGASKPSQIEDNLGALDVVDRLDEETMNRIQEIIDDSNENE